MKKNYQKFIVFFFKLSLFLIFIYFGASINFLYAQQLEVDYPGFQPTTQNLLPNYVKYIFTFIIAGAGMTALWYLIEGGIRFLTSMGKPERMKDARDQIVAVFWGTILLLASYLILNTINPQLTVLRELTLEDVKTSVPTPPLISTPYSNYLWRITEIAQKSSFTAEKIKNLSEELMVKVKECDCKNAVSSCLCERYYTPGCIVKGCHIGPTSHPCPEIELIKNQQQLIIASVSEIIYYRNRAEQEREDILLEIKEIETKGVPYHDELITAKENYLSQLSPEARKIEEKKLEELRTKKEELIKEKELKKALADKLRELNELIEKTQPATESFSQEIDKCENEGFKEKCKGVCLIVGDGTSEAPTPPLSDPPIIGCHNSKGCLPKECKGGNPCSEDELENIKKEILNLSSEITSLFQEITGNIEEIINL